MAAVYEETVAIPDLWSETLERTKKKKKEKALSKTEGAAMGLLAPPTNSATASLIGWLGGDNPDGDPDEMGIVGVRDGDSGVEVLLVEQRGENIATISTDRHPESREIDLQELPSGALRERLMQSLVSIPSTRLRVKGRGLEEVIDDFVYELEKKTCDLGVNATINLDMLRENLGSDDAAVRAVDAFAQAFVKAMPTGKQNTFANRTLPEAIYVSVREDQPVSLVGAFENAVTSREDAGFLAPSVSRLVKEAADIEDAYGIKPLAQFTCGVGDSREQLRQIQESVAFPQLVSDLDNLVTELLAKGE